MRSERQARATPCGSHVGSLLGRGKECDLTASALEAKEFLSRAVT